MKCAMEMIITNCEEKARRVKAEEEKMLFNKMIRQQNTLEFVENVMAEFEEHYSKSVIPPEQYTFSYHSRESFGRNAWHNYYGTIEFDKFYRNGSKTYNVNHTPEKEIDLDLAVEIIESKCYSVTCYAHSYVKHAGKDIQGFEMRISFAPSCF